MPTIYIMIERDRESRSSREGARFRVRLYAQPGGPALLMSTRYCPSVTHAKKEAETLFGELEWSEPQPGDIRTSAVLEIE
jgi:hypothetical protein